MIQGVICYVNVVLLVQNVHTLLTNNMSTRKTVQLSPNTYNELVKMGDLNSSFDSVIANLIKIAKRAAAKPKMTAAEEIIRPAQLIELYKIGFKLVPLDEDGKPAIAWTDIYENTNYWNPDKLVQESYRFKNVATTFGKTNLKDDQGSLYLYALDIDSEEVYNILFRLSKGESEEFSLIPKMQQCAS